MLVALYLSFLASYSFLKTDATCFSEMINFQMLSVLTTQKTKPFIAIAVRTSSYIKNGLLCSGMLRSVAFVRADVLEEISATVIRVKTIGTLGTTLAVTSNRSTLRRNAM
jgi:hypothetical protein